MCVISQEKKHVQWLKQMYNCYSVYNNMEREREGGGFQGKRWRIFINGLHLPDLSFYLETIFILR